MSAYLTWQPGAGPSKRLLFDAVVTETQEGGSTVTEHPVERGANVADHVRANLDKVRLEVFVSNSPTTDVNGRGASVQAVEITPPQPERFLVGGSPLGLSNAYTASVLKFDAPFDAVAETLAILQQLKDEGTLVTVIAPARDYEDMVITSVSLRRNKESGDGGFFDLELKQIRLVEVLTVNAPIPAEPRGQKAKTKGQQNPKPAKEEGKKKSVLKSLLDGFTS